MNVRADVPGLDEARRTLLSPVSARDVVTTGMACISGSQALALDDAIGRVVLTDIRSAVPLPRFDNSAVDGYGLHRSDLERSARSALGISGVVRAGEILPDELGPGCTFRVFTGSRVPPGVAAVVAQERTTRSGSSVVIEDFPGAGSNIRRAGEDVTPDSVIVPAGTRLDARHVAILAAAGLTRVSVRRRLRVGVLSTGSELAAPGHMPSAAGIIDTNGPMLRAALRSPAIDLVDLAQLEDNTARIAEALLEASTFLDLILTTGGVGGSDTDLLHEAICCKGGHSQTLRLALRPGKPLIKGRLGDCHIIGLPGNPIAALVSFLLFGRPAISRMLGTSIQTATLSGRASERFDHKPGRTEFMPVATIGQHEDGMPLLSKLGKGGSARLLPLVSADAFAEIGPDVADIEPGGVVRLYPFSTCFSL